MTSDKKAQANRENGRTSQGPVSANGKARVRLNALKDGLFAKELVLTVAGENQKEFDELWSRMWDRFLPQDVVREMLVREAVSTYWRLQRSRRCEAAAIRKQLATARYRRMYEKMAEVNSLKSRFLASHAMRFSSTQIKQADPEAARLSCEETRQQLEQSSLGLAFLIEPLEAMKSEVETNGFISQRSEVMLVDACGIEDETVKACLGLNKIAQAEIQKRKKDKKANPTTLNQNKQMFAIVLGSKLRDLSSRKTLIEKLECAEEEAHLATLVLPPAECLDRIHRAEAAMERRFYKALNHLMGAT